MFRDRTDAGERLAAHLEDEGVSADVVLAVPRGGLPVAGPVADALEVPLDVVVARKLGAPHNPELAIGAVAADGSRWLNDDLVERLDVSVSYLEEVTDEETVAAREKLERYRGATDLPDLQGRTVLIVDDGIATGATLVACIRQARAGGAERVLIAAPASSRDALDLLEGEVDRAYVLAAPTDFGAVGAHYRDFAQVTDEEALELLSDAPGGVVEG